MMTYSFNFFSKDIEVNDLIVNKKKVKKEKNKKMNILSHVKLQNAHHFFEHKTQARIAEASFQSLNFKREDKMLIITL